MSLLELVSTDSLGIRVRVPERAGFLAGDRPELMLLLAQIQAIDDVLRATYPVLPSGEQPPVVVSLRYYNPIEIVLLAAGATGSIYGTLRLIRNWRTDTRKSEAETRRAEVAAEREGIALARDGVALARELVELGELLRQHDVDPAVSRHLINEIEPSKLAFVADLLADGDLEIVDVNSVSDF